MPRLQAVGERHPGQVPEGQHVAEAVRRDVHGRQDDLLVEERVPDVEQLERVHEDHRAGDFALELALLAEHARVEHGPADEARPELAEALEVEGPDPRVELAAHPEVVDGGARVARLREQGLRRPERRGVEAQGQERRDDRRGDGEGHEVVVEEREVRGAEADEAAGSVELGDAAREGRERHPEGEVAVHEVGQARAVGELCALDDVAGQGDLQQRLEREPS